MRVHFECEFIWTAYSYSGSPVLAFHGELTLKMFNVFYFSMCALLAISTPRCARSSDCKFGDRILDHKIYNMVWFVYIRTYSDLRLDVLSVMYKRVHNRLFDLWVFLFDAIPCQLCPTKIHYDYVRYWIFSKHCWFVYLNWCKKKKDKTKIVN